MTEERAERARTVAIVMAVVMIAQQVAAKTTRDALFLSHFDSRNLLFAMLGTAALSALVAVLVARGMARLGPARLAPKIFGIHSLFFVLEWWLSSVDPKLVAAALYLHVGGLGATAISAFWSVVNERFDPHFAKKAVALIGGGGTVGGIVGGLLAERVTQAWGVTLMLPTLAVLNSVCALLLFRLGAGSEILDEQSPREAFRKTLHSLVASPFLQKIAALVVLIGITASVLDFTMKAAAASRFRSPGELSRFFALFYTVTSVLTFAVQAGLASRILRSIGLSATIAILPLGVLVSSVLGAVAQGLWSAVLATGLENVLKRSLFRSGYELLYTPIAPSQKRPAKALIDIAFDRLGGALGAGLLLVVVALVPSHSESVAFVFCACVSVITMFVAFQIHQDYVRELAQSLRAGIVRLGHEDTLDATTTRTLANTVSTMNRDDLLLQVEALRISQLEKQRSALAPLLRPPSLVFEQVTALATGDRQEIAQVLAQEPMHPALVSLSAALSDDPELGTLSLAALRRAAPRICGQLGDIILDQDADELMRCRLLRLLGTCRTEGAVKILSIALEGSEFDLRYHAGQAFLELIARASHLAPSREVVLKRVDAELALMGDGWRSFETRASEDAPYFVSARVHERASHALEHILTLLALSFDRAALRLCLKAMCGSDRSARGTAMEYLHSILPLEAYTSLRPLLDPLREEGPRRSSQKPKRNHHSLLAELERSASGD